MPQTPQKGSYEQSWFYCSCNLLLIGFCAGFEGCVCVWDVRIGASTTPHLMHHWEAHAGSEILTILHDPMKNVIITAGNDGIIKVKEWYMVFPQALWLPFAGSLPGKLCLGRVYAGQPLHGGLLGV